MRKLYFFQNRQVLNFLKALAASFIFCSLIYWHLKPVIPIMDRTVPGYYDMGNNTSELLSTTRSLIRHPFTFWRGQYTYPYEYNNALINSNYLIGFPYYLIYKITDNACLAYNGILILIFFLNAFAIYLLINYWTGSWLAAIFAGIICAFFPHRFHDLVDYHYQITFIPPLALYAWLLFLRKDKLQYLILFFFFIGIKAVTLDYITIYLLAFLIIIIPAGLMTYPERLKKYWWQFLVCSSILLIIIIPFYIPYWINQNKLPHIGWIAKIAGTTRVELLDWNHLVELFKNFFYNITNLRQRSSYIPDAPILPGVIPLFLSSVSKGSGKASIFFILMQYNPGFAGTMLSIILAALKFCSFISVSSTLSEKLILVLLVVFRVGLVFISPLKLTKLLSLSNK